VVDRWFKYTDPYTNNQGAAWLRKGAAGLSRVQRGLARWLAVKQARVRISARHPMEVPPTEPTAMKI
jgi:hypothetical protein